LLRAECRGTAGHESVRVKRSLEESCETDGETVQGKSDNQDEKRVKIKHSMDELNKLDPIMLEPVTESAYIFVRPNGTRVAFNIESLVDYFLATGEFYDPETRLPFSDLELKKLDAIARTEGLNKRSVYEAKLNAALLYSDLRFRRDALLGLERCAGEMINEVISIIEEGDDDAELQLLLRVFPSFADLFRQMVDADRECAKQSMSHWISFIKGPPNKPNQDLYGLQLIITRFLESCLKDY
jgi:hypothetical protein